MLQRLYSCYAWPVLLVNTIIFASLSVLAGYIDRSGRLSHFFNRLWGKWSLLTTGIRTERIGTENIPEGQSVIIVANHRSYMDILVMLAAFPLHWKLVSKDAVLKVPFIGWAIKAAGYICIDRKQKAGNRSSLQQSLETLQAGASLIIFPEGTIPIDAALGSFHPGAFSLAAKTGAPILPVSVSGTGDILPKHAKLLRPGRIRVIIHPLILSEGRKRAELRTAAREAVLSGLDR